MKDLRTDLPPTVGGRVNRWRYMMGKISEPILLPYAIDPLSAEIDSAGLGSVTNTRPKRTLLDKILGRP